MKEFWDTALLEPLRTLGGQFLTLLPNVLAMTIILSVGWGLAWIIAYLAHRVLRMVGLDNLSDHLGVSVALARGGVKSAPSYLVGIFTRSISSLNPCWPMCPICSWPSSS